MSYHQTSHGHKRYFYFLSGSIFIITEPINDEPATHGNGSTIGFKAESPEDADAWHAAGVANGGKQLKILQVFVKAMACNYI